ncbi:MAG TPA: FlgD immunoglobulin-like domain containing protein, partial [Candidatus Krumholzibacteria bacterium]|nr:FlgD immunoglobulin-like domain containing protein [Candidatus Krumholzibacteria bacterium]
MTTPDAPADELVTIDFAPPFSAADGIGLALTDQATGLRTSLFPNLSYSYSTTGGTRTFTLEVGAVPAPYTPVEIGVGATAGGLVDSGNIAMVAAVATDGYDAGIDLPEPTPPPSHFVAACFEHDGWPLGPRFRRDARGDYDPLTETKTWPLMVETDQAGPVTLSFTPNFDESAHINLMLHDLQSGQTYNMFPDLSYVFDADGASTYRFELRVGGVPLPELAPTSRTLAAGWSLIGLPLAPDGSGTFDDVVLGQVPGTGYAFDFTTSGGYGLLDGSDPAALGHGYWLATDTGFTWTMTGERTLTTVPLPLESGWNLIGYPLWFPGPVESVRVTLGGVTLPWPDALLLNWVSGMVDYDQVQDDYVGTVDLQAWHGYWVAAMQPGTTLSFSWPNFLDPPLRLTKSAIEVPAPADRWRTVLSLDDGSGHVRTATIGADATATDGFDAVHDLPRPPSTPTGGTSVTLLRPEWHLPSGDALASDITAPLNGRDMSWRVRVKPARTGKAELSWVNRRWPDGQDFELYHVGENRVVVRSMRAEDHVSLDLGAQAVELVVRTPGQLSGVADEVPFAGYDLAVQPNPFNPATTIRFALPHDGRAEVRIYSVRGELVAELGGGTMAAGPQQVTWRGLDRAGRAVPSGAYFARLLVDGRP